MDFVSKITSSTGHTNRYIQPHNKLADNIISHSIDNNKFISLYDHYKSLACSNRSYVVTVYSNSNTTFTVRDGKERTCKYEAINRTSYLWASDDSLEYVGEITYPIDIAEFHPSLKHDHERQKVEWSFYNKEYNITFEALLENIVPSKEINMQKVLNDIREGQLNEIISLSYKFNIHSLSSTDLIKHIEKLRNARE